MNEIAIYNQIKDPIAAAETMGVWFAKSGMFGCTNEESGKILALTCLTERMTPMEVNRTYHIFSGKASMRADAMLVEMRKKGGEYKVIQRDAAAAEIEVSFKGQAVKFRLTWEDAQKERFVYAKDGKTLKDNWATPRGRTQMLWARVVSDGVRTVAPEVVAGTYTPEEVQEETMANLPALQMPPKTEIQVLPPVTPAASPAPVPTPAPVVDIKAEVMPASPPPAPIANEPASAPAQVDPPPPAHPALPATSSAELVTVEQLKELQAILDTPEKEEKAMKWFVDNGRLQPGESPARLSRKMAERILGKKDAWLRAIGA